MAYDAEYTLSDHPGLFSLLAEYDGESGSREIDGQDRKNDSAPYPDRPWQVAVQKCGMVEEKRVGDPYDREQTGQYDLPGIAKRVLADEVLSCISVFSPLICHRFPFRFCSRSLSIDTKKTGVRQGEIETRSVDFSLANTERVLYTWNDLCGIEHRTSRS